MDESLMWRPKYDATEQSLTAPWFGSNGSATLWCLDVRVVTPFPKRYILLDYHALAATATSAGMADQLTDGSSGNCYSSFLMLHLKRSYLASSLYEYSE